MVFKKLFDKITTFTLTLLLWTFFIETKKSSWKFWPMLGLVFSRHCRSLYLSLWNFSIVSLSMCLCVYCRLLIPSSTSRIKGLSYLGGLWFLPAASAERGWPPLLLIFMSRISWIIEQLFNVECQTLHKWNIMFAFGKRAFLISNERFTFQHLLSLRLLIHVPKAPRTQL